MTKRILCLILALLSVLSLASPAFGDEAPAEPAVSAEEPAVPETPAEPEPTETPAPAETPQPMETPAPAAAPEPAPVKAAGKLPVPEIGKPSCTAEGVKITWTPVPGAVQYRVYYKTAASWKRIAATSATILTWVGAKSGTKYTFTVRAFDAAGKGGYYDAAGRTLTYVAAPKVTKTTCAANGVKLQWDKVSGAAVYRVYYKTPGGWQRIGDTTKTSYTWTKAQSGESYTFTVRCLSANKKSFTSAYHASGWTVTYLAPPKLSKVSAAVDGVKVQWEPVPGAAQYRVFYKTTGGWKRAGAASGTSFTWTGAKSGTKYAFTVRCLSADGTEYTSAYDTAGKTLTYVAAPRISKAESTARGLELTWNAVSGAANGYRVFYKSPTGWKRIGDTTKTTFTWAGAQYDTGYLFTVRCLAAGGKSYVSAYDTAGFPAVYTFLATHPLDNLGRVSGLCQGSRGCCMATSFSMAANIILGRDEYGPYDWTAPGSDSLNIPGGTSFEGSDGSVYRPYVSSADSAEGLREIIDQALASGCPIISSVQNRSTANTHYAVLVGWTDEAHSDYLVADPSVANGPMTTCAVPMRGDRNLSLGNKNGTFVYIAFSRS